MGSFPDNSVILNENDVLAKYYSRSDTTISDLLTTGLTVGNQFVPLFQDCKIPTKGRVQKIKMEI